MGALQNYKKRRGNNIEALQRMNASDRKIARQKDKDGDFTRAAKKAQKRVEKNEQLIQHERQMGGQANDVIEELREDNTELQRRRLPFAREDKRESDELLAEIPGRARAEQAGTVPPPEPPPAPEDPEIPPPGIGEPGGPSLGEAAIARAEAARARGEMRGEAINPDLLRAQITAQEQRLAEGEAMLRDNTTANDIEGYNIIAGAAGAIRGLNDELKELANPTSGSGTAATVAAQMFTLSQARRELFDTFGRNFQSASGFMGPRPMTFGQGAYGGNAAAMGGGGGITINNSFPTPPADPHTWSKGIAYELRSIM
jgi:hypothetical protein